MGFTLKGIKGLLELNANPRSTCSDVKIKTDAKMKEVGGKIRDLKKMKKSLQNLYEACGESKEALSHYAIEVLKEIGIDISKGRPKRDDDLPPTFLAGLDYVITLCAEEICPVLPAQKAERLHGPIQDPVSVGHTEQKRLEAFRRARDRIEEKLKAFVKAIG